MALRSVYDEGDRASSMAMSGRIHAFSIVIRIFCMLPLLTGAADLIGGTDILVAAGAILPKDATLDPVLNSQIKFWGAIWLGYGAVLWKSSENVITHSSVLRIMMGTLFLSGLGRSFAAIQFGWPSMPLTVAMVVELCGSVFLFAWHRSIKNRFESTETT